MSLPLLLPLALTLAPAQAAPDTAQPAPEAPAAAVAAPAPTEPAPPATTPPVIAVPAPTSSSAELADPLTDPAQLTPTEIDAQTQHRHYPGDPLEGFNRAMFKVNRVFDKALYRPAAMGYKHAVPKPLRSGLRNFFGNLSEPVAFINYLLQLRFGKAARTFARFTINSTWGIGGIFDLAKTHNFKLPHQNNSFGDTLAWYGVKPGPYVFLPLIGPSTLRDLLGGPVDDIMVPLVVFPMVLGDTTRTYQGLHRVHTTTVSTVFSDWRYMLISGAVPGLDLRVESDEELKALMEGSVDPYASMRSAWLQNRAAETADMHHHAGAAPELEDPLADPAAAPPAPSATPATDPRSQDGTVQPPSTPPEAGSDASAPQGPPVDPKKDQVDPKKDQPATS